jgi:hypothetical protein
MPKRSGWMRLGIWPQFCCKHLRMLEATFGTMSHTSKGTKDALSPIRDSLLVAHLARKRTCCSRSAETVASSLQGPMLGRLPSELWICIFAQLDPSERDAAKALARCCLLSKNVGALATQRLYKHSRLPLTTCEGDLCSQLTQTSKPGPSWESSMRRIV